MRWLRLALVPIILCVVVDLSCPQVPGALSFELDGCVDGVASERVRASLDRPAVALDESPRALERPTPEITARAFLGAIARSRADARTALDPRYAVEPPSPVDDH